MSGEPLNLPLFPGNGVLWASGDEDLAEPGSVTLLDLSRVALVCRNFGSLDGACWAGDDVREFLLLMRSM